MAEGTDQSVDALREEVRDAFSTIGKAMQAQQAKLDELNSGKPAAASAPSDAKTQELRTKIWGDITEAPERFAENLITGAVSEVERRTAEREKKRAEEQQVRDAARRFFDKVWSDNPDIRGIYRDAVMKRFYDGSDGSDEKPSERVNAILKELRTEIAKDQATAIEMSARESAEKRMAASPRGQVGWQRMFGQPDAGGAGGGDGKDVSPQAVTQQWAAEQNAAQKKKRIGAGHLTA